MRITLLVVFCVLFVTLLASAAGAYTSVFSAADYTWIKPSMKVIDDDGATTGQCVVVPLRPNHSETEQPPTDDGNVTIKGTYTLRNGLTCNETVKLKYNDTPLACLPVPGKGRLRRRTATPPGAVRCRWRATFCWRRRCAFPLSPWIPQSARTTPGTTGAPT